MISLWIKRDLLRDFMWVLRMCPWIGRTRINEPWRRGDRAISRHGARFCRVNRPLEVAWAGSQPNGSKGVGWLGQPLWAMQRRQGIRGITFLALQTSWLCSIYPLEVCVCAWEPLTTAEQDLPSKAFPSFLEENINSATLLPFCVQFHTDFHEWFCSKDLPTYQSYSFLCF